MTLALILRVFLVSCVISKITLAAGLKTRRTVPRMDGQCDRGNHMLDWTVLKMNFFYLWYFINYVIRVIIQNSTEKINFKHCKTIQLMVDILLETLSLHSAA